MDLNFTVTQLVTQLTEKIAADVNEQLGAAIAAEINTRLANHNYENYREAVGKMLESHKYTDKSISAGAIDFTNFKLSSNYIETGFIEKIVTNVNDQLGAAIATEISTRLATHNYSHYVREAVGKILEKYEYTDKSIAANAIDFTDFKLSGNHIEGGLIENFSSIGIDDRSTRVALTLLDEATVIENNLLTKDLTVEGKVTINGDLLVNGSVPSDTAFYKSLVENTVVTTMERIDQTIYSTYSSVVFNHIKNEGLDLNKITLNGAEIFKDNALAPAMVNSNLQTVGTLKELQVSGESLLSQTLYVTAKRVGVNTIEPSAALAIWDDEVEIVVSKRQKDTGSIGTPRQQKLILSANNKDNITLETDGSARINDLRTGSMRFTSASAPPNYLSEKGHVVWNENPSVGGPLGWICLGAANWGNFGIID